MEEELEYDRIPARLYTFLNYGCDVILLHYESTMN